MTPAPAQVRPKTMSTAHAAVVPQSGSTTLGSCSQSGATTMTWVFGRSWGAPRHPLVKEYRRLIRRRVRGVDHEAFSRQLLSTPLYLATKGYAKRLEEAEIMVMDLGPEHGTALPAYLEVPSALVALGHIGGTLAVNGSDACRVARERECFELALFADPERDPEIVTPWGLIDWLGAGLMPYFQRNAGDHAILLDATFVAACRAAVEPIAEIVTAELMEGVPADGTDRPVIIATLSDSISPRRWFEVRGRIESELMKAGYVVTVVTECEQVILETYMTTEEMMDTADERHLWLK